MLNFQKTNKFLFLNIKLRNLIFTQSFNRQFLQIYSNTNQNMRIEKLVFKNLFMLLLRIQMFSFS